ncbi:hypothetical protein KsCSTR_36660 [Candidatus Kuenenia stuttgartiensis]|uniref:Uncharacterized protein n=1 Tax=Kuenenia stuttgartiensis TaxID=174633 RepID=Q1Q6G0_KUEST|nr:hypothetical protein KsCSTR_36660 [Candidatus Kuenenia stuttgartiensis]CAJ73152.1 unknown protein [Candidatus Kuenenia stuttgartiensis]
MNLILEIPICELLQYNSLWISHVVYYFFACNSILFYRYSQGIQVILLFIPFDSFLSNYST